MTTVFFSYSHQDESWRNELEIHLQALQRQALIDVWHDRRIAAGDHVHETISEHLESASIILLLVSPYFIASDYCYNIEMARALERHEKGEARVIPVILEHCAWQDLAFGSLRATPTDGKPVSSYPNKHEAFLDVVNAIKDALASTAPARRQAPRLNTNPASAQNDTPIRSSNLRVRREFTDEDNHQFLESAFEYMAKFFEGSVNEIDNRNADITAQFRRFDANKFDIVIFRRGQELAGGTVWLGNQSSASGRGIYYVTGRQFDSGSYNECLTVVNDGYAQFLRGFGLLDSSSGELTERGAAEYLWRRFIDRLQ